jgi:hypothetical protein
MASYNDTFTPPADVAAIARAALEAHEKGERGGSVRPFGLGALLVRSMDAVFE